VSVKMGSDYSIGGTLLIFFRQAFDGDRVKIESRQEETERAASHPRLVKLVAVSGSTDTVYPLGPVRLFGAAATIEFLVSVL
jgi:hypothetical protein